MRAQSESKTIKCHIISYVKRQIIPNPIGAAWLNARQAITVLVCSDCSSSELDERSRRVGMYSTTELMMLSKHAGPPVCRTWYVIVATLKSILYLSGSQCKFGRTGWM